MKCSSPSFLVFIQQNSALSHSTQEDLSFSHEMGNKNHEDDKKQRRGKEIQKQDDIKGKGIEGERWVTEYIFFWIVPNVLCIVYLLFNFFDLFYSSKKMEKRAMAKKQKNDEGVAKNEDDLTAPRVRRRMTFETGECRFYFIYLF